MSDIEARLQEAFSCADQEPAPDLFARIRGSIEDDRRRRRRTTRVTAACALGLLAVAALTITVETTGGTAMTWWMLERLTCAVLVGMALWLGPFIKRFGRAYAADVFRDNPSTGKSYIVLTDIVYYLIFGSYILFTIRFQPAFDWADGASAGQMQYETARIAGILLVIGVLHGLNILLMPVLGRLFALNRRLDGSR